MKQWDKLSPLKIKFLNDLGIFSETDLPQSFFSIIEKPNFTVAEKFCVDEFNKCYSENGSKFFIKDLVGTDHERYINKTWWDAFVDLARGDYLISLFYKQNGSKFYFDENFESVDEWGEVQGGLKSVKSNVGITNKDGKLYINAHHGGGNNRLILAKIIYLALADKCTTKKELEQLDNNSWYRGYINYCPKEEIANDIFLIEFPNGGYASSGFNVGISKESTKINSLYYIFRGFYLEPEIVEGCETMTPTDIKTFRENMELGNHKKL